MSTVIEQPDRLKDGYRMLMLVQRRKEGGTKARPDRVSRKLLSKSVDEYNELFQRLLEIKQPDERIYASLERRNIDKAIRIFKQRQLDADYFDIESKHSFYTDISNRWFSAFQAPQAKDETLFLVDFDYDEGTDEELNQISREIHEKKLTVVHQYKTKNGYHIILEPFNPGIVSFPVKKDALLLLAY